MLLGAIEAAKEKLIIPVLVGPERKIRAAAEQAKLDLSSYELVPTEHSQAAAAQAVALARDCKVEALMKGSLHTDEFMGAIVHEEMLHTSRRMSHVFVIAPAPPSSADPKDRFYESQGLRLHYADWGNDAAPPLILIHGGRTICVSAPSRACR